MNICVYINKNLTLSISRCSSEILMIMTMTYYFVQRCMNVYWRHLLDRDSNTNFNHLHSIHFKTFKNIKRIISGLWNYFTTINRNYMDGRHHTLLTLGSPLYLTARMHITYHWFFWGHTSTLIHFKLEYNRPQAACEVILIDFPLFCRVFQIFTLQNNELQAPMLLLPVCYIRFKGSGTSSEKV